MIVTTTLIGLIVSVFFSAFVLISFKVFPEAWLSDLTEGRVQAPRTPGLVIGFVVIIGILVGGTTLGAWWAVSRQDAPFFEAFLAAFGVMVIINLVDLIVLDIIIYIKIYPDFMHLDGVEPLHRYGPHVLGAVKGLAMGLPIALIATTIASSIA